MYEKKPYVLDIAKLGFTLLFTLTVDKCFINVDIIVLVIFVVLWNVFERSKLCMFFSELFPETDLYILFDK